MILHSDTTPSHPFPPIPGTGEAPALLASPYPVRIRLVPYRQGRERVKRERVVRGAVNRLERLGLWRPAVLLGTGLAVSLSKAKQIAIALAHAPEPMVAGRCVLCGQVDSHGKECPWFRAVQWCESTGLCK